MPSPDKSNARRPRRDDRVVVGHFDVRHDIIVWGNDPFTDERMWYAEMDGSTATVGSGTTVAEAIKSLMGGIRDNGHGNTDARIAEQWLPESEGWIENEPPSSRKEEPSC